MKITSESWNFLLSSYRSCEYFNVQLRLQTLRSEESLTFKCCIVWLRHYDFRLLLGFSLLQVVHVFIAGGLAPCPLQGMKKKLVKK